jgi:prepilin-type N-terminal cleavage/methylation domain-containing protein
MKTFTNKKGMTLVEMMVATTIGLVVVTIALSFVIQFMKTYQYETGKLLINRDIRKFTAQMIDDATYANSFMIFDQASNLSRVGYTAVGSTDPTSATYKGYTTALATTAPDSPVTTTGPGTTNMQSGMPGDVVVFVYNVDGDNTKVQQLILYYRWIATPAGGSTGTNSSAASGRLATLYRLVVAIPAAVQDISNPAVRSIWHLLPDLNANTPSKQVFQYVDGQANDLVPTGSVNRTNKMFYNISNNSVLIRARIYENYTAQRLVKSTYNFTVTPRG